MTYSIMVLMISFCIAKSVRKALTHAFKPDLFIPISVLLENAFIGIIFLSMFIWFGEPFLSIVFSILTWTWLFAAYKQRQYRKNLLSAMRRAI
jgi:hypothetical protein